MKRPRRRILPRFTRPGGRSHESGKFPGPPDRPSSSSSNNRLCNLFSKPFFAIAAEHLPDFGLVRLLEPLERALAPRWVHAHVKRPVRPEAEAAPRVVELRRGHAQIEQHPIDTARAQRG